MSSVSTTTNPKCACCKMAEFPSTKSICLNFSRVIAEFRWNSPQICEPQHRRLQAIFIAVGTPQSETGSADLSYVDAVASEIARSMDSYKVIVEKSTVPVYTNEWIRRVIERNGVPKDMFDVTSNPEFLREGTAVVDFLHADRIVIGAATEVAADLLKTDLSASDDRQLLRRAGFRAGAAYGCRSAADTAYLHKSRRNYQARLQRPAGNQDFIHQRCRECL